MPGIREHSIHGRDRRTGLAEQHLVDQQGNQQRHRHADQGTEDGDDVRQHEFAPVLEDHLRQVVPVVRFLARARNLLRRESPWRKRRMLGIGENGLRGYCRHGVPVLRRGSPRQGRWLDVSGNGPARVFTGSLNIRS